MYRIWPHLWFKILVDGDIGGNLQTRNPPHRRPPKDLPKQAQQARQMHDKAQRPHRPGRLRQQILLDPRKCISKIAINDSKRIWSNFDEADERFVHYPIKREANHDECNTLIMLHVFSEKWLTPHWKSQTLELKWKQTKKNKRTAFLNGP